LAAAPQPTKPPASTEPTKAASTGDSKGAGFLTINAQPYATLYVDGKKRGYTPIVRLTLPPGEHSLRLVSSAGQPDKKLRVEIKAGKEVRKFVKW
jgi:serine/threonine-protein kinase